MNYNFLRSKYNKFIYDRYEIDETLDVIKITYFFEIEGLSKFNPTLEINKKDILNKDINKDFLNDLIFHIGMVELISYWKCAMPKEVIINAGYLDNNGINFFKKLYYNGLGEFFYQNKINIEIDDLMDIIINGNKLDYKVNYNGNGNLIPIGGGKDSIVTMNLLKNEDNKAIIINPKEIHMKCAEIAGLEVISLKRTIDKNLIDLNKKGFLNGHTPFSSLVSFVTYLMAYLSNKKYIILSNESSANESNIEGKNINHQYSKSYEYENDFKNYTEKAFNIDIHYFSLLRPLSEIQIAYLFSKYKEYHNVFKSCNVGSKNVPWCWCCNCPKCLFVYIILSPFLSSDELINIFGENLLDKKELLDTFLMLIGKSTHKPFECVGTYNEVNYAISTTIEISSDKLPYLLEYYKNHFNLKKDTNLLKYFDTNNNLDNHFENIVRGAIND